LNDGVHQCFIKTMGCAQDNMQRSTCLNGLGKGDM
jgi:hypothetical protein